MSYIPNEILREIVEAIDPSQGMLERYTLQNLRLVNRAMSYLAGVVLFEHFDTFHVGHSLDDLRIRVPALARSDLRHKVKGLNIARAALLPQAIVESSKVPGESLHDLFTGLDHFAKECASLLRKLVASLGQGFRFEKLYIGFDPGFLGYRGETARVAVTSKYAELIKELAGEDAFSVIRQLHAQFYPRDLPCLFSPPFEAGESLFFAEVDNRIIRLLNNTDTMHISIRYLAGDTGAGGGLVLTRRQTMIEALMLGHIITHSSTAAERLNLVLEYHKQPFLKFYRVNNSESASPSVALKILTLVKPSVPSLNQFSNTILCLPSLEELRIYNARARKYTFWNAFFERLRTDGVNMNLRSVYFHKLVYLDEEYASESDKKKQFSFTDELGNIQVHRWPILSKHRQDPLALKALLLGIKQKREQMDMGEDLWLSEVLSREEIFQPLPS